jgi:hypothetical protein
MMPLPFPNVPNLPGVPPIPRSPGQVIATVLRIGTPATAGALAPVSNYVATQWGVLDQKGNLVVDPDSIIDFDNRNEWNVVSMPVQAGSFASYNKVVVPFECSVRMTKGGSINDRTAFLQQIAAIAGDTNLYDIITPERVYQDVNITRYEVSRRGAGGAYFLAEVDLYFVQILQVTPTYTNTSTATQHAAEPSAQPATNQGNVNPQPVKPAASSAAAGAINYSRTYLGRPDPVLFP